MIKAFSPEILLISEAGAKDKVKGDYKKNAGKVRIHDSKKKKDNPGLYFQF